jgi:type II secretory pathway pseudopilin PulG
VTLIELMVVVVLIALVVGSAVAGLRSMAKSDLRSSASKMAGAIRYLFDRASTTGKIHRLVLDMDKGRYWAEVSDDRFIMAGGRETEESRQREADQARQGGRGRQEARRGEDRPRRHAGALQAGGVPPQARKFWRLQGNGSEAGRPQRVRGSPTSSPRGWPIRSMSDRASSTSSPSG